MLPENSQNQFIRVFTGGGGFFLLWYQPAANLSFFEFRFLSGRIGRMYDPFGIPEFERRSLNTRSHRSRELRLTRSALTDLCLKGSRPTLGNIRRMQYGI